VANCAIWMPTKRKNSGKVLDNGGSAKSAKRNKKGNPKRKLALEYIVKLINDLPSHIKCEWLTADELLHLLIVGGIPLGANSVQDVSCIQRRSCRRD
jgi:hypothetical protein